VIFPKFLEKDSEWFHGETYLLILDLNFNVLFFAYKPTLEGNNVASAQDWDGKLFMEEFVKVAQTKGSGWVDFMWPKQGEAQPSHSWAFVKSVTVDGVPGVVEAAFYPE
jgi:cytochrome c